MDLSRPISIACPGARGAVLGVLLRAVEPLSGREVARRAGTSVSVGARHLHDLVSDGIVSQSSRPPSILYVVNNDHLALPALLALSGLRTALINALADRVQTWKRPAEGLMLFGSVARGDSTPHSDVDVLVIRPDDTAEDDEQWTQQVAELARAIERWTGNPASVIEYTPDGLRAADAERLPLLRELRREAVSVTGSSLRHVLRPSAVA